MTISRKPDTLLFDVGGVLMENCNVAPDVQQYLGLPPETFNVLWPTQIELYGSGQISRAEFWQGLGDGDAEAASSFVQQLYRERLVVREELQKYLLELKAGQAGVRLAILSDTNADHGEVLCAAGVYDFADPGLVFLSYEIKQRKSQGVPVFRTALTRLNREQTPEKILFIDDNQANLILAKQVGMRTLLALNEQQIIDDLRETLK